MKIKKLLSFAIIIGCIVNNSCAMDVKQQPSDCISNTIQLDKFWQKVKSGKISQDEAQYQLQTTFSKIYDYTSQADLNKKFDKFFKQAVCAGMAPSTPITCASEKTIIEYALTNKNESLVQCCFELGYSPDSIIIYHGKKTPVLAIAPSPLWPLFKKYGADFNIIIEKKDNGTLLHKALCFSNCEDLQWLLQETTIDINQPDNYGNTAGHYLAYFYDKKTFEVLKQNRIDPFQRNNNNETPRDRAQAAVDCYQEELSIDLTDFTDSHISLCIKKLADDQELISLWEEYEKEYVQNNYKNSVKHCYCRNVVYSYRPDDIKPQAHILSEQIMHIAYNFFPSNSIIGSFCKQHPDYDSCIAIAKLYANVNAVHRLTEKREYVLSEISTLKQQQAAIWNKIGHATDLLRSKANGYDTLLQILDRSAESHTNFDTVFYRQHKEAVINDLKQKLGMPNLYIQIKSIHQRIEQLNIEYHTALREENIKRKMNFGYHSALDFNTCSGKSSYHRAIKDLLQIVPHELKMIEAEKVNQGLHNAYHNKRQS